MQLRCILLGSRSKANAKPSTLTASNQTKRQQVEETVKQQILETYQWTLVPSQPDPTGKQEWEEIRLQGHDSLALRVSKKLINEELLVTQFAGTRLRLELDRIPLWRGDRVGLKELSGNVGQYPCMPRLTGYEVLLVAVQDGLNSTSWQIETFAYADRWDEKDGRYVGLRAGHAGTVTMDDHSVLVKPDVAARQLAEERDESEPQPTPDPRPDDSDNQDPEEEDEERPRRFFGSKVLDPHSRGPRRWPNRRGDRPALCSSRELAS